MDEHELHGLAAPYALRALENADEDAFEQHLVGCPLCRAEVAALEETASALALGVEGPAPPAVLRERILDRARAERPTVVLLERRPRRLAAVPALAAASAAAAIGVGAWAVTLSSSLDKERAARRTEARVLAVLAQPGAARYPLAGDRGALVVAPGGEAVLLVSELPRAPGAKVYEAWVVAAGRTQPAGLFPGGPSAVVALTRAVPPGAHVGVTLERAGGAERPTEPMRVTGHRA